MISSSKSLQYLRYFVHLGLSLLIWQWTGDLRPWECPHEFLNWIEFPMNFKPFKYFGRKCFLLSSWMLVLNWCFALQLTFCTFYYTPILNNRNEQVNKYTSIFRKRYKTLACLTVLTFSRHLVYFMAVDIRLEVLLLKQAILGPYHRTVNIKSAKKSLWLSKLLLLAVGNSHLISIDIPINHGFKGANVWRRVFGGDPSFFL